MKRSIVIAAGWLALSAAVTLPAAVPAVAQTAASEAAVQTATFAVENMTCALCPITVMSAMGRVDGVVSVEVDMFAQTAEVVFDPSTTTIDAIASASTNAGYPARIGGS